MTTTYCVASRPHSSPCWEDRAELGFQIGRIARLLIAANVSRLYVYLGIHLATFLLASSVQAQFQTMPPGLPEILTINGPFSSAGGVGEGTTGFSGANLCIVGDIDGDGIDDIVVSAPGAQGTPLGAPREIRAVSVGTGSVLFSIAGATGSAMGSSLAKLGDLDGDGTADFAASEFDSLLTLNQATLLNDSSRTGVCAALDPSQSQY